MDYPKVPLLSNTIPDFQLSEKKQEKIDPQISIISNFIQIGDPLPLTKGNIPKQNENQAILSMIGVSQSTSQAKCCWGFLCCLTICGLCYLRKKTILIPEGHIGFALNSGKPEILEPGWHCLPSPLVEFKMSEPISKNPIEIGPITIVRITEGYIGTAIENANLEILLPGTHCRRSGTFKFMDQYSLSQEIIQFNQIKIITVLTGFVRVCYDNGKASILKEGKYAINNPTFTLGPLLSIQQQNLKFDKHNVMLDGGIQMLVEGLLTYQIIDVEKLIQNIGSEKLVSSLENVSKAEISKIFSAIHLEQISSITHDEVKNPISHKVFEVEEKHEEEDMDAQNQIRIRICEKVIVLVKPIVIEWGVRIINFQLESLKLTDIKYGQEYEAASLEIAKAKACLKANIAKNEIRISQAEMEVKSQQIKAEGDRKAKIIEAGGNADAQQIKAEGNRKAKIIEAEGIAGAMTIEAKARNEASLTLKDDFSKDLLILQEKVNFARELKATTLVISDQNGVSKNVVPMLNIN